jgi:hypothetical protein
METSKCLTEFTTQGSIGFAAEPRTVISVNILSNIRAIVDMPFSCPVVPESPGWGCPKIAPKWCVLHAYKKAGTNGARRGCYIGEIYSEYARSPCSVVSRPSRSDSSVTRRPMVMSTTL